MEDPVPDRYEAETTLRIIILFSACIFYSPGTVGKLTKGALINRVNQEDFFMGELVLITVFGKKFSRKENKKPSWDRNPEGYKPKPTAYEKIFDNDFILLKFLLLKL